MERPSYLHMILILLFDIVAGVILYYIWKERGDEELAKWYLDVSIIATVLSIFGFVIGLYVF